MKSSRWIKVIVFVLLALASLSSIAATRAHEYRRTVYITPLGTDACVAHSVGHFEQYSAAIAWAEEGGELPFALRVGCVVARPNLSAYATYPGESADRFRQYSAAIEWAENGGPLPVALSVSHGSDGWDRFEQYMDAIEP
jgi:hypothetical protein